MKNNRKLTGLLEIEMAVWMRKKIGTQTDKTEQLPYTSEQERGTRSQSIKVKFWACSDNVYYQKRA